MGPRWFNQNPSHTFPPFHSPHCSLFFANWYPLSKFFTIFQFYVSLLTLCSKKYFLPLKNAQMKNSLTQKGIFQKPERHGLQESLPDRKTPCTSPLLPQSNSKLWFAFVLVTVSKTIGFTPASGVTPTWQLIQMPSPPRQNKAIRNSKLWQERNFQKCKQRIQDENSACCPLFGKKSAPHYDINSLF